MPIAGWAATGGKWAKNGLQALGASTFVSAEGLIWASRTYATDPGSLHALNHVYRHFTNLTTRDYHGIFTIPTNELIGLIDEAWKKVKNNDLGVVRTVGSNGNISYLIPMGNIGKQGGRLGHGGPLNKLRIWIDNNNPNHIITAYPE